MRLILLLLAVTSLAACGRPLTSNEIAFLTAMQGDQIEASRMRIIGDNPAASFTTTIPVRPRVTCQERIWPPMTQARRVTVSPVATVIYNRILIRDDVFRPDFLPGWPDEIDLLQAMLFAHEAVHVWQWQNRDRTGYSPLKALREHATLDDPYLFDASEDRRFLDFGYEQQGSIVEEYVCCRLLDPEAPRTARLRALIGQELPIAGLDQALGAPRVRLPWAGADTDGICRPPA